jgi:O-antigen ligase
MENRSEWLTDKYILVMLTVFPLWTGFSGYSVLTVSKFSFFAGATGLWLFSLIVCSVQEKRHSRITRAGQWGAVAFMLAALLSALFSPTAAAPRWRVPLRRAIHAAPLRSDRSWRFRVRPAAESLCICAGSIVRNLLPDRLFPTSGKTTPSAVPRGSGLLRLGIPYSGAFLGTIGNTDVLAALFCLAIPLFTAAAVLSRERYDTVLLIPAALCLAVLIRSGVSSGILAVGVCALVSLPYLVSVRFGNRTLTLVALSLSAASVAAGLIVLWLWRGTEGTVYELSQLLHGNVSDSFGSSRILIWREALGIFSERPLLGGGPDTFTFRTDLGFPVRGGDRRNPEKPR